MHVQAMNLTHLDAARCHFVAAPVAIPCLSLSSKEPRHKLTRTSQMSPKPPEGIDNSHDRVIMITFENNPLCMHARSKHAINDYSVNPAANLENSHNFC